MEDISSWKEKFEVCYYTKRLLDKVIYLNGIVKIPSVDVEEVKKAIYYARKYHGVQIRQSGEPYYSHPLEVAYMVADYLFRTDIIVTSILHDTIEDTKLTKNMIVKIFGEKVANQVMDLTRVKEHGKITSAEMVEILYKEQKHDILLIKLFDRVHNMQTISAKSPEKIKKITKETFNSFIIFAIEKGYKTLAQKIYHLCYNALFIPATHVDYNNLTKVASNEGWTCEYSIDQSLNKRTDQYILMNKGQSGN